MDVTVRRARPADGARIADIYNHGIRSGMATFETKLRSAEDRRRWIERHQDSPAVVAVAGDVVIGFAYVGEYRPRECYKGIGEFSVYVDEAFRSRGVGKMLIDALLEEATMRGYWKLVARIFDFNIASRQLCATCGFREVGTYEKHGKLDGTWVDCVIVEKVIAENLV